MAYWSLVRTIAVYSAFVPIVYHTWLKLMKSLFHKTGTTLAIQIVAFPPSFSLPLPEMNCLASKIRPPLQKCDFPT